jgi:hypothetical protein
LAEESTSGKQRHTKKRAASKRKRSGDDPRRESRLERWEKDPWQIGAVVRHEDDDDPLQNAWRERIKEPKRPRGSDGFGSWELTRMAKEIIYCHNEKGMATFNYVIFGLDLGSAELTVSKSFELVDPDREELIETIGLAYALNVPVVPNTPELATELEALEREFFTYGIKSSSGSGRLMPSSYVGVDIDSLQALESLGKVQPIHPSEVRVLMETVRRELGVLAEAQRAIDSLRGAIEELSKLLTEEQRPEGDLQRCLTRHPILFGPEYIRVVPKFRLGGDFEMDFALQRSSGLIDLVEIEAARHPLFTKKGNPRSELVHAEQQVLDWLRWIEHYGELARRELPELSRPVGLVVIGRDSALQSGDEERLRQRNAIHAPAIEVMTYDGLLRRAESLERHFRSLRDSAQGKAD